VALASEKDFLKEYQMNFLPEVKTTKGTAQYHNHLVIFGTCLNLDGVSEKPSYSLPVSPVYFNAANDCVRLFDDFTDYSHMVSYICAETYIRMAKALSATSIDIFSEFCKMYPILGDTVEIFQKGRLYDNVSKPGRVKRVPLDCREAIRDNDCYFFLWEIGKKLPDFRLKKGVSATPDEVPHRCIHTFYLPGKEVLNMKRPSRRSSRAKSINS
jgi:hypothetical protein